MEGRGQRLSKKKKKREAAPSATVSWLCSPDAYESLVCQGYTRLSDNPEVQMAANYVADLISSMTIYLMRNTGKGDVRQRDELARKVDVNPSKTTTRKVWMFNIVRNMMLYGNQVVYPKTVGGLLDDLVPFPPSRTNFAPDGDSYVVYLNGRPYAPNEVLHFLLNPDPENPWKGMGYRAALKDVVGNLKQAAATKRGFMESKWKPSVIIKADAMIDEFAGKEGRKKLLSEYVETSSAGEPWVIPAEQFDVVQVKPLSLNDLAINEAVTLDKKAVAAIIGVPPYVVGAGDFDAAAHKNFIATYVRPKAQVVEQELTRKLLLAPDRYFRMNAMSLYGYDIESLARVGESLAPIGIVSRNEVRDWIGKEPKEGLDELIVLENYIPHTLLGAQSKLNGGGNAI